MSKLPLVSSLLLLGCAHTFPAKYDLEALRADSDRWPGEGLVHYLSRPGATTAACEGSNFARQDSKLVEPFVDALPSGKTNPRLWSECAVRLVPTLPAESRAELIERLADLAPTLLAKGEAARVRAVYDVLASRPREPSQALGRLRAKLAEPPEAPAVRPLAASLKELLDLELGTWHGQPLTEALVLELDDEPLLRRIDARVPVEPLRTAARRRIVRLHLAKATMREVREKAAEVEALVLARGRWVQPVASLAAPAPQPPLVAPIDVRFSQDLLAQVVRPFVAGSDPTAPPTLDLRPLLRFHVGWSEPLPLCDEPAALSVTPCIDPAEVRLGTGFATLDPAGVLHLTPKWAMADAIDLTRAGLGLVVPVKLGERLSQVVQVPLTPQVPNSFCFEAGPGERGPTVGIGVLPVTHGLIVDAVEERGQRIQFVLPRQAVGFEFGSCGGRGLPGAAGVPGIDGANGNAGSNAVCPSSPGGRGGNGGNGTPGGPGGDGGPGGEGGAMRVELHCGTKCEDDALVRAIFRSKGGPGGAGGPGGKGGRGGRGGSGGSSTSCTVNGRTEFLSRGSDGSSGSAGANGRNGNAGPPGRDGPVEFVRR